MGAPTVLTILLDSEEYSKFEIPEGRSIITVTITASGGGDMSGEILQLDLIKARRDRDTIVYTKNVTIVGTTDPVTTETTIDLNLIADSRYINLIRHGIYFFKITSLTNTDIVKESSDFYISLVTAEQLRKSYLFGITLDANDVRNVLFPPKEITGVEITEVSGTHSMGFDVLNYRRDPNLGIYHLSWGKGGPIVQITQPGIYILRHGCRGDEYITVRIKSLLALPSTNKEEELLIVKDKITNAMLRRWIDQARSWLEQDKIAGVFLEPTRITTSPLTRSGQEIDWDYLVPPLTYFCSNPTRWIDILFPYMSLLKIDELYGRIANTDVVSVDINWVEIAEKNGFVQLVPFNQTAAFQFIGLIWVESLRGRIELPNFWRFNAVAGLRQTDPVLLELIAKKASIDALITAGHAYRGGFSSQSISKDGISQAVSYTASAIYGIYSATIDGLEKFINKEVKQLRGRYRGVNMAVM